MRLVGARVERVEDQRILTGQGHYIDDLQLPGMLHAAFLRSPFAHARITHIDASPALTAPGVVAVYTGQDLRPLSKPIKGTLQLGEYPETYPLVTDKVLYVGDLVAMVVAESRYLAEDALDLIEVEYDPLPAVMDYEAALDPSNPPLFADFESNLLATTHTSGGDVDAAFADADRVIDVTLRQHRIANVPMETRGAVADFDHGLDELTYYSAHQGPHGIRLQLASTLDIPLDRLRVVTRDVGGAFGLKGNTFREDFCLVLASKLIGRPVKWIEDRHEHLSGSGHAREEMISAQVAVSNDGDILGLKADLILDQGAYPGIPFPAVAFPSLITLLLPGPYKVRGYSCRARVVATNKCTYVAYRGPWAMETWARERLLDIVAHELGLEPAEIRRRNFLDGAEGERLITGLSVHGITSRESLDRALERIDLVAFREEQSAARSQGRYLGLGMATFIEAAPGPPEMRLGGGMFGGELAKVRLEADGRLAVITAQAPHGQGHETTLAQVAADEMGVPFEHVRVVYGDTRVTPFSVVGTGGSRAATWATGAVVSSTRRLKEKILAVAGDMLEISAGDLEIIDGAVTPEGRSDVSHTPRADRHQAHAVADIGTRGRRLEPGSRGAVRGRGRSPAADGRAARTPASSRSISARAGVKILRYVVVEDCGPVINPAIVEGQVRGGVAQGIGSVLLREGGL